MLSPGELGLLAIELPELPLNEPPWNIDEFE
jgi:hypothetical protein